MDKQIITKKSELIEIVNSVSKYQRLKNVITNHLNKSIENFIGLGKYLSMIKSEKLYKFDDYETFDDFCNGEIALSRYTCYRFIALYERFGKIDDCIGFNVSLKDEYKNYNMSQLIELLNVPEDEMKNFSFTMPVSEIRESKRCIELKKQLARESDSSHPRSALSIFINEICNSKSYKYPGVDDPISLKLVSRQVDKKNSYSYYKEILTFNLVLNVKKIKLICKVRDDGSLYWEDLYMYTYLKDYIDGVSPTIKKQFTEAINKLLKETFVRVNESNKNAEINEEKKLFEKRAFTIHSMDSYKKIIIEDEKFNLIDKNFKSIHFLAFLKSFKLVDDFKWIDLRKDVVYLKCGLTFSNPKQFDNVSFYRLDMTVSNHHSNPIKFHVISDDKIIYEYILNYYDFIDFMIGVFTINNNSFNKTIGEFVIDKMVKAKPELFEVDD